MILGMYMEQDCLVSWPIENRHPPKSCACDSSDCALQHQASGISCDSTYLVVLPVHACYDYSMLPQMWHLTPILELGLSAVQSDDISCAECHMQAGNAVLSTQVTWQSCIRVQVQYIHLQDACIQLQAKYKCKRHVNSMPKFGLECPAYTP